MLLKDAKLMDDLLIEKLLAKTGGSVYKLVILASRRAAELNAGAPPLVEVSGQEKVSTITLGEILQGKVGMKLGTNKHKSETNGHE